MTNLLNVPRPQRIGIVVFDDFEPLDVFGFVEAFSIARKCQRFCRTRSVEARSA